MDDENKNGNGKDDQEQQVEMPDTEDLNVGELERSDRFLPERIHILPLNDRPLFPGTVYPISGSDANFARTISAVESTQHNTLGFVLKKEQARDADEDEPISFTDIYKIGVAGRILKSAEDEDGQFHVLVQLISRMEIVDFYRDSGVYMATVTYPKLEADVQTQDIRAHTIALIQAIKELVKHNPLPQEQLRQLMSSTSLNDPSRLADFAAALTSADPDDLQEILETYPIQKRLRKSLLLLKREIEINEIKEKINKQIQEKITKQQREYFLREQLKAIKKELGLEKDEKQAQIEKYKARLEELTLEDDVRKVVEQEIDKFSLLETHSAEFGVVRNYLEWLLYLPWGIETEDNLDPVKARKILDRDHYGLNDVKDRIVEFIAVSNMRGSLSGSILCLVGPPGVGKTSIGRAVAEALNRKFFRFSLGGMRDEAEIKGHRRTYIGAMPGKIMQSMKTVGTQNPVVMLDEIDKVGASFRGDPASALLEVLDPEQNFAFRDHYLDVPFDLRKVLFISTANVLDTIPAPLLDRMEVIKLSGYIQDEKLQIAKRHIIPRQLERHKMTTSQISFSDAAINQIIDLYAKEAGVRNLEKTIRQVMRKVAVQITSGKEKSVSVSIRNLTDFLGKPRFPESEAWEKLEPGVIMGLAWTPLGGVTLYVEGRAAKASSPGFRQTGQLGDVMKESSAIAYSYIKSLDKKYGFDPKFFDTHIIHLHVPAGATPKDGPSAGVTMASALLSLVLNRPAKEHVAMTGELTLTGRVLPVGGIKEKLIAAHKSKAELVFIPAENERDLDEVPEKIKEGMRIEMVARYDEIADKIFELEKGK